MQTTRIEFRELSRSTREVLCCCLLVGSAACLFAQGGLTPPAAPAPTMKTLDQIEPRIPVTAGTTPPGSNALFRISQPGSYFLVTNLSGVAGKHGIVIESDDVTLDLRGFVLTGVAGSLCGVQVNDEHTNLFIRNGVVRRWGEIGVNASKNVLLESLLASDNGSDGFRVTYGGRVKDCVAMNNTGSGIFAFFDSVISDCTAVGNSAGIYSFANMVVKGCVVADNTGLGIQVGANSVVTDCTASHSGSEGFFVGSGSTVRGCTALANQGEGFHLTTIFLDGRGAIIDCTAQENGGSGVAAGFAIRVDGVVSSANSNGIAVGPGSDVARCVVFSNRVDGIVVGIGGTVRECTVRANGDDGIEVPNDCRVQDNNCTENGKTTASGSGVHATIVGNRIEANTVILNKRGLWVEGGANFIVRNTARFNNTNYSIVAGNNVGPIVAAPASGAISGSTGGAGVGTTDPWANFSF